MAKRAVGGEPGGNVRRIGGALEVRLVAGVTGGGSVVVVIVGMALRAGHRGMFPSERIVREHGVIELGIRPV